MNMADEIIKRAKTRIEAGWLQHQFSDKTKNNVCLTQALNEAADEVAADMPQMPVYEVVQGSSQAHKFAGPDQALVEVNSRVNQAIAALNPGTSIKGSLIAFNDSSSTTQADVVNVLNYALKTPAKV